MNLTSFRTYLKVEKPKAADYVRFLHLLLQGISIHAVEGDPDEMGAFRREVDGVSQQIDENSGADSLIMGIGVAIHALEEYNRRASRGLQSYGHELKALLAMMAETIAFLSASSHTGIEKLHSIEENLARASDAGDVRLLREKLSECLTEVRNESVRLRSDSQAHIESLKSGVARVSEQLHTSTVSSAPPLDPTTGLPSRGAAEQAIAHYMTQNEEFAVALFMVDRLPSINGRFGRIAGDKAMILVAQQLAQQLECLGSLMRWSGPSFVALFEITNGMAPVERHVKEAASLRIQMNISTADRQVMVPLTCSFVVNKIRRADAVDVLFQKLDNCLAVHTGTAA